MISKWMAWATAHVKTSIDKPCFHFQWHKHITRPEEAGEAQLNLEYYSIKCMGPITSPPVILLLLPGISKLQLLSITTSVCQSTYNKRQPHSSQQVGPLTPSELS